MNTNEHLPFTYLECQALQTILLDKKKKFFGVCTSIETDLHITLFGKAPDTHLQRRGPRLTLCPRRRCSSGVEKLRLTQTHGTLQNRHVKSQARESHWKKNRDVVQREDKATARTVHHQYNLCSFRCDKGKCISFWLEDFAQQTDSPCE